MKICIVTQARMTSSRLPGKVLKEILGQSLLSLHLKRIQKSTWGASIIVATTNLSTDNPVQELVDSLSIAIFRGSEQDVLDRYYQALKNIRPLYVVRLTSDCPLIDAQLMDDIIEYTISNDLDYCSNVLMPTYPDGQDIEVFKFECLEKAWKEATLPSEREHVTPYIWKYSTFKGGTLFKSNNYSKTLIDYSEIRMTVDDENDFQVIKCLIEELGAERTWSEYADYLENNENIKCLNATITRNQGYEKSINQEI